MTSRQFLEIREGCYGAFGNWLRQHITKKARDLQNQSTGGFPNSISDIIEREQTFGKVKVLNELLDEIPDIIETTLKELEEKERSNEE